MPCGVDSSFLCPDLEPFLLNQSCLDAFDGESARMRYGQPPESTKLRRGVPTLRHLIRVEQSIPKAPQKLGSDQVVSFCGHWCRYSCALVSVYSPKTIPWDHARVLRRRWAYSMAGRSASVPGLKATGLSERLPYAMPALCAWATTTLPKVSAVIPVPSETKKTVRLSINSFKWRNAGKA